MSVCRSRAQTLTLRTLRREGYVEVAPRFQREYRYRCLVCNMVVSSAEILRHMRSHHRELYDRLRKSNLAVGAAQLEGW